MMRQPLLKTMLFLLGITLMGKVYTANDADEIAAQSIVASRDATGSVFAAGRSEAILLAADTSGSEGNGADSANDGAAYIGDPAAIERGRQLYGNTCLFCHGAKGVGARAPTLVAGAWAPGRGNTVEYMYTVVMEGRPGTIMGSFKETLQPQEVWQIAAYLRDQADTLAANK